MWPRAAGASSSCFAVSRTQEIVYDLHQLSHAGEIPELPIYVDSPLAVNVTEAFRSIPTTTTARPGPLSLRVGPVTRSGSTAYAMFAALRSRRLSTPLPIL